MRPRSLHLLRLAGAALALGVLAAQATLWLSRDVAPVRYSGAADIEPKFNLTDHTGRVVTDSTFLGRPVVYMFGTIADADLTPAALQVLRAAAEKLKSYNVVTLFLALDPQRDTPAALTALLTHTRSDALALMGTADVMDHVARQFRIHLTRRPDVATPGGMRIDHSQAFFVFGRDGRFKGLVRYDTNVATVAREIEVLLK